jgi:hypothetical protein
MDTYNNVDFTPNILVADYMELHRSLYKYFENPTQEEELA